MIESALTQYGFPGLVTAALVWFFRSGGAIEIEHLRIGPSTKPPKFARIGSKADEDVVERE
jgi:hypothetical protein